GSTDALVPEMPDAGEHHRDVVFVGGGDDFVVAHRTPRLDDRADPGRGRGVNAVAERKEGVARHDRPRDLQTRFLGLERGDLRAYHATHLSGADADAAMVARIDDGVGLDVLGDAPGEHQVLEFGRSRRAPGDDLQFVARDFADVAGLHQQARTDALDVEVVAAVAMRDLQYADVRLLPGVGERAVLVVGCDQHLDEL